MDRVFLGLAGLLLGISLGLGPWEIPGRSPASPWKTLSIPPLLLGLTQYVRASVLCKFFYLFYSFFVFLSVVIFVTFKKMSKSQQKKTTLKSKAVQSPKRLKKKSYYLIFSIVRTKWNGQQFQTHKVRYRHSTRRTISSL